jgi:hypothetical protein
MSKASGLCTRAQDSGAGGAACPDRVADRRRQARPEDCPPAFDRAAHCCSPALAFSARRYRRAGTRCSAAWAHAFHLPGTRAYGDCQDHTGKTFSCNALEHSQHGRRCRYQRGQRTARLARSRSEAAPCGNLQAEQRLPFRRETGRHRRPVSESARTCAVLSLDEKSQIQPLDRTQPSLPMKKGRAHRMTMITSGLTERKACGGSSRCSQMPSGEFGFR